MTRSLLNKRLLTGKIGGSTLILYLCDDGKCSFTGIFRLARRTMVEAIGMQQVLSLSSVTEKVQQTTQLRGDVVRQDAETDKKEKEMEESKALPPSEQSEKSVIKDEYTGRKGMQYKARQKKKAKNKAEEDEAVKKSKSPDGLNLGSLVDLVI